MEHTSRQVERFHGSFEYSLDAKGRLILPARLRSEFETKKAYVSGYMERCLAVWPPAQFDRFLAQAEVMEAHGSEGRNLARVLSALSTDAEFDAQWRLTIPANLREYAGLEPDQPVMVVGALSRVELWRVELWHQRTAASVESLANGTSPLFSEPGPPASALQPAGGSQ
jgi:MraZ protein